MNITRLILGPVQANCYIIKDEKSGEAAVIDPGEYTPELEKALSDEGVEKLKYILLTHGHYDHILGVQALKTAHPEAKIAIHPYDCACLQCEDISLANQIKKGLQSPVDYDLLVEESDVIEIGETSLRVMHTPGHTLGGVCYVEETQRVIFSGDTLFCHTVGRTDLPGGDWDKLCESLMRLIHLDGDYTVYTGHNRSTSLAVERERNRYLRRIRQMKEGTDNR